MAMNAKFSAMLKADLDSMMADWSETLTHIKSGQQVSGTFSPVDSTRDVDPDGILSSADAEFVCKLGDFTTLPANGDNVRIAQKTYHILSQVDDTAILHLRLRIN